MDHKPAMTIPHQERRKRALDRLIVNRDFDIARHEKPEALEAATARIDQEIAVLKQRTGRF